MSASHVKILFNRIQNLPLLLEHFLERSSKSLGKKIPTPPKELITLLGAYRYPGNIRELESIIFDAVSKHVCGKLLMEVFKFYISTEQSAIESGTEGLLTEQLLITEAMKRSAGNQDIAAMHLGISRQASNRRLRKAHK